MVIAIVRCLRLEWRQRVWISPGDQDAELPWARLGRNSPDRTCVRGRRAKRRFD
jgi:hypothetical protein